MFKKIFQFFVDCKGELKKVAWPSKQELYSSVLVVVVSLILFSAFITLVDWLLKITIGRII
jgi:preprotein translocase subunit SecE